MNIIIKNVILAIVCLLTTSMNAQMNLGASQRNQYEIKIGNQRFTPQENIQNFTSIKKELTNNYIDGWYHVLVQFHVRPDIALLAEMRGKVHLEVAVSSNTYIASISSDVSKRRLKKLKIRAILPLDSDMKVNQSILSKEETTTKVNIVVPNYIKETFIKKRLKQLGIVYELKIMSEAVNKYTIQIKPEDLAIVTNFAWVLKIEEGGMR